MQTRKLTLIGLAVVIAAAMLVWGFNFLKGNNILITDNYYYAVYQRVDGLVETSPVYLYGYQVGQVEDLRFSRKHDGKLLATIRVNSSVELPRLTTAEIYDLDLLGTKGIRLIPGKKHEMHKHDDTLAGHFADALTDKLLSEIEPVKQKAEKLAISVDTLVNKLQLLVNEDNQKNINTILTQVAAASIQAHALMRDGRPMITNTLQSFDSLSKALDTNRNYIVHSIQNIKKVTDSLVASDLRTTMLNIRDITSKIDSGQGTAGQLVHNDTLYQNLENATKELEMLLKDLRENPERYVHISLFGK